MLIGVFSHRERDRRATVADILALADLLGLVDVAEGGIVEPLWKNIDGQRMLVAAEDASFAELADLAPDHIAVAGGEQGLTGLFLLLNMVEQLAIEFADTLNHRVDLTVLKPSG